MRHTPGPWEFVFDVAYTSGQHPEPDYEYARISSDKRFNIAKIYPDSEEWRANARLIAAAPDLLAALETVMPWASKAVADHYNQKQGKRALDIARAAIAKATQP